MEDNENEMTLQELIDSVNAIPTLSDDQLIQKNFERLLEIFDDPDKDWDDMED